MGNIEYWQIKSKELSDQLDVARARAHKYSDALLDIASTMEGKAYMCGVARAATGTAPERV